MASSTSPLLSQALPIGVDEDITFAEPWEARAFAMIVKLAENGYFTWSEWVECFSTEVAAATAAEVAGGSVKTYYQQWLNAAENLMISKGVTSRDQLAARKFALSSAGPTHQLR